MKNIFHLILSLMIFVFAALVAQAQNGSLVFRRVSVIDMRSGRVLPEMTVVIKDRRIAQIGKTSKLKIPKNSEIIDASGKFLIPGLWDMHVHTLGDKSKEIFFPLFIANGVTGVRDMGTDGTMEMVSELRNAVAGGQIIGPEIVAAGKILDGPEPKDPSSSIAIATAFEGRNAVRLMKRQGADFIKVYNGLPREAYFAIADEAKKQGLPFVGHIPISVTAAEASNAGQKSIEHLFGVHEGSTENENELREQALEYAANHFNYRRVLLSTNAVESFNEKKAGELIRLFAKNHTWQCPTLILQFSVSFSDNSRSDYSHDNLLKYLYPQLREEWNSGDAARQKDYKPYYPKLKLLYSENLWLVRKMQRSGVPLLAGTDAVGVWLFPGFSLHDELSLLVQAGLTPLQALQTATINPAKFLGREKDLGTIEKGKHANLVLLDANPLADINNTRKINAVVLNGRFLNKKTLDKMLADVEAEANKK